MTVYEQMVEEVIKLSAQDLYEQWSLSHHSKFGPLFAYCCPSRRIYAFTPSGHDCGCLTQIRQLSSKFAWTHELTLEIRADERIPRSMPDLLNRWDAMSIDERRAVIMPFAEWQERLDKELNREPPVFQPAA